MRRRLFLSTALVLAMTIISTVFSILTAASPRWTVQNYYLGQVDPTQLTTILTSAHRSPFYRCGIPLVADDGTYSVPNCTFYPPKGFGRTSCRVPAEVGADGLRASVLEGTQGSYMECQQVHMAGNLQIAATVFTGLGLLVSFAFVLTIGLSHRRRGEGAVTEGEVTEGESREGKHRRRHSRGAFALGLMAAIQILFLMLGAALQVLAQFFGVLGLSQNATPNASLIVQEYLTDFGNFTAGDWILDIALVRYASVAWLSAIFGAVGAGWLFWRSRVVRRHA